LELPLVPNQDHPEEKEEVGAVGGVKVVPELRIHEVNELIQGQELVPHTRLVAKEVSLHAVHELLKCPEGYRVVLDNCVNWRKEIRHALDIAKILVVLVVCKKHLFHLLHVDVGANISKW
jgi:hypothetical protein